MSDELHDDETLRAIVIDDSRAVRMILGKILREMGYDVVEAGDGADALEKLHALDHCEIALVDWNMPNMNGIEFIQAVRALPEWEDLRILMVTSESDASNVAIALEAGADEYAMKPFDREIIAEKLELLGVGAGV